MSEARHHRDGALDAIAKPGRFGAAGVGVTLRVVRRHEDVVLVIARKDAEEALAKKLTSLDARWAGPGQFYVFGAPFQSLEKKLRGVASCADQSHARVFIEIAGPKARDVLAKGSPVDFDAGEFPPGKSALTQMAHTGVHVTRTGEDAFELSIYRGFAESFWEWLVLMCAEYGYQVD